MRGTVRSVAVALATTTALSCTIGAAFAGGFAIREQSAYGQGSSFAGVSAGGESIATMFWNPATMTQHSGFVVEGNATLIAPNAEIDVDSAIHPIFGDLGTDGSGELGIAKVVPASYLSYQVSEDLFLGLAVTSPFGLVTDADTGWSGRFHGRTSDLMTINVNPNVAYKLNDFISFGVGVQAQWADARLTQAQVVPHPILGFVEGSADLTGDDWAFGWTAGVTLTPWPTTTIGIGFRSALEHDIEGSLDLGVGNTRVGQIPGSALLKLPEQVTIGVRHELNDRWTLLGQAEWSNWSRFDELRVELANGQESLTIENWDDGYFFSVGAEYKWSPDLTLRGGIAYEISPVPDEHRTPRIPDSDRFWVSVGATYKIKERLSLDVGYSHIFAKEAPIELDGSGPDAARGSLFGESEGSVDILSVGLRYKFGGDPSYAPPAEPFAAPAH